MGGGYFKCGRVSGGTGCDVLAARGRAGGWGGVELSWARRPLSLKLSRLSHNITSREACGGAPESAARHNVVGERHENNDVGLVWGSELVWGPGRRGVMCYVCAVVCTTLLLRRNV